MICRKNARRLPSPPLQMGEHRPVLEEEDAVAVAGGKGVVGDHEDGGLPLAVEDLEPIQQQLGGLGVQGPGGSSARIRAGSVTMARAAAVRCRWPPDI